MTESADGRATDLSVVVAGSGVAALEAVLALRAFAGDRIAVELVAPDPQCTYWPAAVLEPFAHRSAGRLPLTRLAETHAVRVRRDTLVAVKSAERRALLASGSRLRYDALILAKGASPERWLGGAVTFRGSQDVRAYRQLLADIERGEVQTVTFAVPPGSSWALPLYELALLTSAWIAERGVIGAELTVATPTPEPLALLGPSAARALRNLFSNRGIRLLTGTQVTSLGPGSATTADERTIAADRVVTLPRLSANVPMGVPVDAQGFVPTDEFGAVPDYPAVYAVGDMTSFAVKQASLAAAQADACASAVAAGLGLAVEREPFVPVLDAVLLTGVTASYFHADLSGGVAVSEADETPHWWLPDKLTARHLAPYLAEQLAGHDRPLPSSDESGHEPERDRQREIVAITLDLAQADATAGNYHAALNWLAIIEQIEGQLDSEAKALRDRWTAASRE